MAVQMPAGDLFLASLLLVVVAAVCNASGPVVQTTYGEIEGATEELSDGRAYDVFRGVPFGASTEGSERFRVPRPPRSWTGTYNATGFRPYCPQLITPFYGFLGLNTEDSEDCLYLNVYVPGGLKEAANLPVMFWVYGGAFLIGATDMYPGEELAVNGKVIVVSVSYRVGVVGFLSTGNRAAEGNWGLWDQVEGLQWVQENIERFGGDKNRVTIFGQSAGGASVSHLSLSPLTKGLFRRVIAISGSAHAYFGYTASLPATTDNLALTMVCPRLTSDGVVDCLRKRKRPKLLDMAAIGSSLVLGRHIPNIVPTVDGYLVSDHPRYALEDGWSKDVDILVGHTRHDAAMIVYLNPLGMGYGKWVNLAKNVKLLRAALNFLVTPYANREELVELIINQYPNMFHEDAEERAKAVTSALTDFIFAAPTQHDAEVHSRLSKTTYRSTYMYEYAHRHSFFKYEPWVSASHIDDLYSVFGEVFMDRFRRIFLRRPFRRADRDMRDIVQGYYANFAYTGNPNQGPHTVAAAWPQYNPEERQYMELTTNPQAKSHNDGYYDQLSFWTHTFYQKAEVITDKDRSTADDIRAAIDLLVELKARYEDWVRSAEEEDYTVFNRVLADLQNALDIQEV